MAEPTFTDDQQKQHREAFIHECRQKAWGAACNAEWIGKQTDELMADYQKLKDEDAAAEAEIKTLETALDSHTKDNRDKRKALQERRHQLVKLQNPLAENMNQAQQALRNLYASVETNLALAKHAEGWGWTEADTTAKI